MEISITDLKCYSNIIKSYVNLKKVIYHIDKAISEEFNNKQNAYASKEHSNHKGGCCGESELNYKIFIPKDKMNNVEKNLSEIYEKFFYDDNLLKLTTYLNDKYKSINIKAKRDGMCMAVDDERDFIHNLLKEGVNFYLCSKLKNQLREFEESVSSAPMLLANPGSIEKDLRNDLLNCLPSNSIDDLLKKSISIIDANIFKSNINEYELFNELKYLYHEGRFETLDLNNLKCFALKFHKDFFQKSRFSNAEKLAKMLCYLPYELNLKFQEFSLQVSDYIQYLYFKKDSKHLFDFTRDSSIDKKYDTGKKITLIFVLFPDELKLSERNIVLQVKFFNNDNIGKEDVSEIVIDKPMTLIMLKSRVISYKIKEVCVDFGLVMYYIHGPIDELRLI